jgi:hypothetical protein
MIRVLNKKTDDCAGAEYVGRPSPLGNPFAVQPHGRYTREQAVSEYESWLRSRLHAKDPAVCAEMNRLFQLARDGNLALVCWCSPQACHADVVKRVLEEQLTNRRR